LKIFPVVPKAAGLVAVKARANICVPVTGGVIWFTAVVPVMNVRNVVGAIVVLAAIVTGFGCKFD